LSDTCLFPTPDHNHTVCISAAIKHAEAHCKENGARLTAQRKRVLEIVWENHRPIGAYEILDRLAAFGSRPAPMTVYRALDFLQSQGLIHRIASLNAFIGCGHPGNDHCAQFLICRECKSVAEIADPGMQAAMVQSAAASGFHLHKPLVELEGICAHCHEVNSQ